MSRPRLGNTGRAAVPVVVLAIGLTACTGRLPAAPVSPSTTAGTTPATTPATVVPATPTKTSTPAPSSPATSVSEPTTTNTLPPPPEPSRPAASTAGSLTAKVLPVPSGWHKRALAGGVEEGFDGNGTWVHARDPRYAATDTITVGCAPVTRDDFTDPVSALEGDYADRSNRPGVGLVLQFRTAAEAGHYFLLYRQQLAACTDPNGMMTATVLPSSVGLVDRRTYLGADQWTEVAKQSGERLTLIVLSDPGHRITAAQTETILHQIA